MAFLLSSGDPGFDLGEGGFHGIISLLGNLVKAVGFVMGHGRFDPKHLSVRHAVLFRGDGVDGGEAR